MLGSQKTTFSKAAIASFLGLALLTVYGGCLVFAEIEGTVNNPSYSSIDPWFRTYASPDLMQRSNAVPMSFFAVVDGVANTHALLSLENKPWRKLSRAEAIKLGVTHLPAIGDRSLFLVRGLALNEATGGFEIFEKGSVLLVHHSSLGKSARPMRRKAIVILLQNEPRDVYVSCSMAE